MPLDKPFAYVVCYELKQPLDKYEPLFTELKRSYRWAHHISNTWLVLRTDSLVELRAKLLPLIFTTDYLLILPAKGPADGYMPQELWPWIEANIPREW